MRILIVDDNVDSADLLAEIIKRQGHEPAVAHGADEAVRVAREFVPDAAFIDIMIRCESGYILARDLRELPGVADCRFIAVTGFIQDAHRRASEAAGFVRHLVKPLEVDSVEEAIDAAMKSLASTRGAR